MTDTENTAIQVAKFIDWLPAGMAFDTTDVPKPTQARKAA
ncbi:hypothetical protein FRUB_04861 [Fimbriiglobus ruber]|uniref:Uncharacterized protein n=1 Tax=Fimbriiglobus ruber TaxID=1908690 RepID=A0A225DUZ6_9BACT|nr:hypothetical protein FRUB_04861 [Fimbriiglobus ruber]